VARREATGWTGPSSQPKPPKDTANVLTSTRILARRRLGTSGASQHLTAPPRRRRRTRGFVQVAGSVAAEKLHLNLFGHGYVVVGAALIVVLFYLGIAAQITQASYDIARLQDQQRQLIAEQDQLRYQEVTQHAPAQVQEHAAQGGLQRVLPTRYVNGQQLAIDLTAPVGAEPTDTTPLWLRAVAVIVNTVGQTREVMASTQR